MNDISYKLIKNGINALLEEEDNYFKKNLVQSLSIKLNEAITHSLNESYRKILFKEESLPKTKDLEVFVSLLENPSKIQLKDSSIINIDENEIKALKELFDNLNVKNKKLMTENLFTSINSFNNHLDFYYKAKGLFR